MTVTPSPDAIVTLRELYTLIEKTRSDMVLEIEKVNSSVKEQFTKHEAVHVKHDNQHDKEHAHTISMIRWGVTTLLAAAGVFISLYLGLR
jgi:hypothetical protein